MKLYIDQYGQTFYANTLKDLRKQIGNGGSKISEMFQDRKDGSTVCVGYVIGQHWLTAYVPLENAA